MRPARMAVPPKSAHAFADSPRGLERTGCPRVRVAGTVRPVPRLGIGRAAEAHVAGAGVRSVGGSGGDSVPVAVGAVTEVGAAAQDAGGAVGRASGVFMELIGGLAGVEGGAEPIGAPLPDVA